MQSHFHHTPLRSALALAALCAMSTAHAQSTPATTTLAPVLVTGNPLASEGLTTPASVLTGTELVLKRGSTLGDTLESLPGVSSTGFGPNANRPIIRGFDGDRIRILSNSGASLDASALSFDHAVPIDPLLVTRIEVLRGPAALLYGGSAVGGVVNAIDNRIPTAPIDGVGGAGELRGGGAANERAAVGAIEFGGSGFAIHADAFTRKTDNLKVPDYDRPDGEGGFTRENRVINSESDAKGGAVGGSWVGSQGYLGASFDTYRNDYGVVAEEDILIKMQRDTLALAGEWRVGEGFARKLRGRLQHTDYEHKEIEGNGEVGTVFKNKGVDGRFELEHAPIGPLRGVIGLQFEDADFSALGEEAFVPATNTRQFAGFIFEEQQIGVGKITYGARIERTKVRSDGDADPAEPKFGDPASRSFTAASAAIGTVWPVATDWQASGNLAYTERAPTNYELYANGVHAATGTFERGDIDQSRERGTSVDLGLQWQQRRNLFKASVFYTRFSNYIGLLATGEPDFVDGEESVPIYAFEGVGARFYGGELEGAWRLLEGAQTVDVDGQVDWVRADNRSTGEPLPRIAPVRLTVGANWGIAGWTLRGEVRHATRQDRVPADDVETPSHTLLNAVISRPFGLGGTAGLFYVRLNNLTNELAFNASTIGTVRPLAPLGERSISAGLRVAF